MEIPKEDMDRVVDIVRRWMKNEEITDEEHKFVEDMESRTRFIINAQTKEEQTREVVEKLRGDDSIIIKGGPRDFFFTDSGAYVDIYELPMEKGVRQSPIMGVNIDREDLENASEIIISFEEGGYGNAKISIDGEDYSHEIAYH